MAITGLFNYPSEAFDFSEFENSTSIMLIFILYLIFFVLTIETYFNEYPYLDCSRKINCILEKVTSQCKITENLFQDYCFEPLFILDYKLPHKLVCFGYKWDIKRNFMPNLEKNSIVEV